ncbi:MAG: ABC transporter ATP-binding protein [Candidatus Saccharimonas sp.]
MDISRNGTQRAQPEKRVLISSQNVNKQFATKSGPVDVLSDVNFTISENSFTIIFGPSGSGKSTLLNVLTGLEPPTSGTLEVAGEKVYNLDSDRRTQFRAKHMGIVHQQNYWVKSLSVLENVAMPLYFLGSTKEDAIKAANESLELVGMAKFASSRPTVLSGGQQQRVSMARALVASPDLILADEPTGSLDSKNGRMIMDLLLSCLKSLGRTVVLITHNIEYLPMSDKQLYIADGRVRESSRGQEVPPEIMQSLENQMNELKAMGRG